MNTVAWDYDIPMLTNRFVLKGLAAAFGIPIGIFGAVIAGVVFRQYWRGQSLTYNSDPWGYIYAAILIGVTVALTVAFVFAIYHNRYEAHFVVDEHGATYETRSPTEKVNRGVRTAAWVLFLLTGNPRALGASLIAQSQESVAVRWDEIHRAVLYPKQRVIGLRNSWRTVLYVYCTAAVYEDVVRLVTQGIAQSAPIREPRVAEARRRRSERLGWIAAIVVAGLLASFSPLYVMTDAEGLTQTLFWAVVGSLLVGTVFGGGPQRGVGLASLVLLAALVWTMAVAGWFRSLAAGVNPLLFALSIVGFLGFLTCAWRNILSGEADRRRGDV